MHGIFILCPFILLIDFIDTAQDGVDGGLAISADAYAHAMAGFGADGYAYGLLPTKDVGIYDLPWNFAVVLLLRRHIKGHKDGIIPLAGKHDLQHVQCALVGQAEAEIRGLGIPIEIALLCHMGLFEVGMGLAYGQQLIAHHKVSNLGIACTVLHHIAGLFMPKVPFAVVDKDALFLAIYLAQIVAGSLYEGSAIPQVAKHPTVDATE